MRVLILIANSTYFNRKGKKMKKIKMTNKEFSEYYREREQQLKEECDQMVADGECSEEEANFRFFMVRDEILWCSEDTIEIVD